MKRILLICFVLMSSLISEAWAQRTVTGKVSGVNNEAIPGVAVRAKGTSTGVITNLEGEYKISVPENSNTLVFSFVGYQTKEVEIGNRSTVDVVLAEDVRQLDEIVVTGQGAGVAKKRLSTTVDKIGPEQLESVPNVQLDQLLQSQLPNAQIRLSSGQPGTAALIRSRGPVSAAVGTTPIIYVDGIRVDNLNSQANLSLATGGAQSSAIADIPVENIERIEYVKGGAATTLFGADAANGVIQIFTKKGTKGQARVNIETQLGSQVGTKDYLHFKETADILFRPGLQQSYRVGVDGGTDQITYSFSGNIYGDESFRYGLGQERHNFRAGIKANVTDWITFTSSAGYSSNNFTRDYNANSSYGEFGNLETVRRWGDLTEKTNEELDEIAQQIRRTIDLTNITERVRRFQNSNQFDFKFSEKVSARALVGIDSRNSRQRNITTNQQLISRKAVAEGTTDRGSISVFERNFFSVTGELNASYQEEVGAFSFLTIGGGQFFRLGDEQIRLTATEVTEGSISINNAGEVQAEDFLSAVTNYGFFAKENIGFRDKLFVEAGIRVDGNTAFGQDIGLQAFPAVGIVYNLSDESFFRDVLPTTTVSTLRFRANYGEAGNFPRPFANDRIITVNNYLGTPSYTFGNPGDATLKPERTATTEIGTDIGFINNRFNFQFTYYDATTTDALFSAPFASSVGQINQLRNIGEINNKGFELSGSFIVYETNDANITLNASYNRVKNVVVSSGGAPEFNVGGFQFLGSFVKEGQPLGYFRGNQPVFNEGGEVTEIITNAAIGSPIAPNFGSTSISARYKRLNFYATGDYQTGGHTVVVDDVLRYFGGASVMIPETIDPKTPFVDLASLWVQSSDFFKVRNLSLMYDVPTAIIGNSVKKLTVGFNVMNPFNFFNGIVDPEVSGAGFGRQNSFGGGGFGYGTESAPRTYLGTVRISL